MYLTDMLDLELATDRGVCVHELLSMTVPRWKHREHGKDVNQCSTVHIRHAITYIYLPHRHQVINSKRLNSLTQVHLLILSVISPTGRTDNETGIRNRTRVSL